jgi:Flp pilus assembly protein TadD
MKLAVSVVLMFTCLFCIGLASAGAADRSTLRGVVVTSDGTLVEQFSVAVRPVVDKPVLSVRRHFNDGTFELDLQERKYELVVTAPRLTGLRMDVDLSKNANSIDYKVVILHPLRNDLALADPVGTVNVRRLETEVPEAAKAAYAQGVSQHLQGDLESALASFRDAMALCPDYAPPLIDTAAIYLLFNRPEAALIFLERALKIDPQDLAARTNVAAALILKKEYDGAVKQLTSIVRDSTDKSLPHLLLAKLYFIQKKYSRAAEMAQAATTENPHLLDGWQLLLTMALDQKDYAEARESLLKLRQAINNETFSRFVADQISTLAEEN